MKMKKKKSLLFIVGLLTFLMFVLSSVLNAVQIYESYSVLQMQKMQEQTKEMTDYVGNELMSYKAVSWLFTYWETHYDEMDIPLDALTNEKWISDHSDYYSLSVKNIGTREVQLLSENEQKKFAETCYILNAAFFDRLKREYHLIGINCSLYHEGEEAFVFFNGLDDSSSEKNYVLGEMWAFHAELHPIAAKIYSTGEAISEIERATSTTDGLEYLFVYTPVIADGELQGLICVTHLWSTVKDEISSGVRVIEIFNFIFLFVTNIILLILLYFLVIKPLSNMQNSVSSYKESKNSSNLKAEIGKITETSNEIGFLASDISDMAEEIDRYINEVRSVTAEKERMATELDLATKIQSGMLPNIFPAFPDRAEFDIYASMDPAKEVGGDFYDFFMIDDDHLAMVIADVSGKGVPAALFMMSSKILINDHSIMGGTPAEILERVNKQVCANNKARMFVTVWLGILEISTGKMITSSAGHEYPMLNLNGKYEILKDKHGPPVGTFKKAKYTNHELTLKKGDSIFVYTDGVAEATDSDNQAFGTDRTLDTLNAVSASAPTQQDTLKAVRAAVDDFVKEAPQFDDITMLGLKYFGTENNK